MEAGDAIIVDGSTGEVQIRPQPDVEDAYAEKAKLRAGRQARYQALRDVPAVTRDGVSIALHANAGLLVDVPQVAEMGAESIGLFRTELQFMIASRFPRTAEQYDLYKSVMDAIPDRPVTFRTLDIGGDKILPYMQTFEEMNPALGWRAIRIGLDRPALLRLQVRALLRAGAGRELRIMFPMVATAAEFDLAKQMVARELGHLTRHGYDLPASLKLGVMIEVPSLLWQLDEIGDRVDFMSVGSNDLVQYLFAADRDNKRVADRFDPLSAPALRAFKAIADTGVRYGKPVTLCGEIGGKPLEAMALIGIGYRSLSVAPSALGPIKTMILSLDVAEATALLDDLLSRNDGRHSVRHDLRGFADARNVALG